MPRNHKYQPIASCIDVALVASCSVTFYAASCLMHPSATPIGKYITITAAGSGVVSTATACCLWCYLKYNSYTLDYSNLGELIIKDMSSDSCEMQCQNVVTSSCRHKEIVI